MVGKRFKDSSKWSYDVSELGYKYNMTDISASFGRDQLTILINGEERDLNLQKYILMNFLV